MYSLIFPDIPALIENGLDGFPWLAMFSRMSKLSGIEMLEKVAGVAKEMEDIENLGESGVGRFVPYNTSHRSNRFLVDRFGDDPRWAWIGMLGGFMRIAEKATPVSRSMVQMKPGDWIDGAANMKLAGFGGSHHAKHGCIKVRLSQEAMDASRRMRLPSLDNRPKRRMSRRAAVFASPPPPPDPGAETRRPGLLEAVRGVYGGLGMPVPEATKAWMEFADEKALEEWLVKAGAPAAGRGTFGGGSGGGSSEVGLGTGGGK